MLWEKILQTFFFLPFHIYLDESRGRTWQMKNKITAKVWVVNLFHWDVVFKQKKVLKNPTSGKCFFRHVFTQRFNIFVKFWYFDLWSVWSKVWIIYCNIWCLSIKLNPKHDSLQFHKDRKSIEWFMTILQAKNTPKIFIFAI